MVITLWRSCSLFWVGIFLHKNNSHDLHRVVTHSLVLIIRSSRKLPSIVAHGWNPSDYVAHYSRIWLYSTLLKHTINIVYCIVNVRLYCAIVDLVYNASVYSSVDTYICINLIIVKPALGLLSMREGLTLNFLIYLLSMPCRLLPQNNHRDFKDDK